MPYNLENIPDRIKGLPERAQKLWINVFNNAFEQYNKDEEKSNATAWMAVKNAGYKQNDDGTWFDSKEQETPTVEESKPVEEEIKQIEQESKPVEDKSVEISTEEIKVTDNQTSEQVTDANAKESTDSTKLTVKVSDGLSVIYNKDSNILKLGGNEGSESFDFTVAEDISTSPEERRTDVEKGNYHVIFVESGFNSMKRRAYLKESIAGCDPKKYIGLQMHLDHASKEGEPEPEVRSLGDVVAITTDAWHGNGVRDVNESAMHGMIHVFPGAKANLAENMKDPLFRKTAKLSHLAELSAVIGQESDGPNKGRKIQLITSIDNVQGVDLVSKDGARGGIVESAKGDEMDWDKLTVEMIKENRSDLITAIEADVVERNKISVKETEEVADLTSKVNSLELENTTLKTAIRGSEIATIVGEVVSAKDTGIPEAVRPDVAVRVTEKANVLDPKIVGEALKTEVKKFVSDEAAFIIKATGRPETTIVSGKPVVEVNPKDELVNKARSVR